MQIFAGGIFPAVPHTYIRTFMTIRKTGRAAALPVRLSKKWHCHFFEKASLRSAPLLSADSGQFDAHSAQSVFCHAHVAAENI